MCFIRNTGKMLLFSQTAPIVEKYLERKYELVASEGEPTAETLRGVRPCLLVSSVRFGRVPKRTDSLYFFCIRNSTHTMNLYFDFDLVEC